MLPGVEISELDLPVECSKASPPLPLDVIGTFTHRPPVHQEFPHQTQDEQMTSQDPDSNSHTDERVGF